MLALSPVRAASAFQIIFNLFACTSFSGVWALPALQVNADDIDDLKKYRSTSKPHFLVYKNGAILHTRSAF
eukprot:5103346-Pleurochrysis_carterae.AAC.4